MPDSLPAGPKGAVFLSYASYDVRVAGRDNFQRDGEALWALLLLWNPGRCTCWHV
jgi:hypothetical protein